MSSPTIPKMEWGFWGLAIQFPTCRARGRAESETQSPKSPFRLSNNHLREKCYASRE